jgi:hypothetical protein
VVKHLHQAQATYPKKKLSPGKPVCSNVLFFHTHQLILDAPTPRSEDKVGPAAQFSMQFAEQRTCYPENAS